MDLIKNLNPLIDADPFTYSCGFAADAQIKREVMEAGGSVEDAAKAVEDTDYLANALANTKTAVDFILEQQFPDHEWYEVYLSGKGNFRYDLATIRPYKGNRDPSHKPKYFKEIREYLVGKYNAKVIEGQEADDAIGIKQYSHRDKSTVICSIDKDLKMIPGYHYNPRTGEFWYQKLEEANRFFWWQMLVGDSVDNIPGINKIGPKSADKILAKDDWRQVVDELYQKQYGDAWKDAMNEVAQLLWIRRKEGQGPDV